MPFYEVWGWELEPSAFGANVAMFLSNFYILNTLMTGQWAVFWDALQAPDPSGPGPRDHPAWPSSPGSHDRRCSR